MPVLRKRRERIKHSCRGAINIYIPACKEKKSIPPRLLRNTVTFGYIFLEANNFIHTNAAPNTLCMPRVARLLLLLPNNYPVHPSRTSLLYLQLRYVGSRRNFNGRIVQNPLRWDLHRCYPFSDTSRHKCSIFFGHSISNKDRMMLVSTCHQMENILCYI